MNLISFKLKNKFYNNYHFWKNGTYIFAFETRYYKFEILVKYYNLNKMEKE